MTLLDLLETTQQMELERLLGTVSSDDEILPALRYACREMRRESWPQLTQRAAAQFFGSQLPQLVIKVPEFSVAVLAVAPLWYAINQASEGAL